MLKMILFVKMNSELFWKCSPILQKIKVRKLCSFTQSRKDFENADIVISGGGMIGFATACAIGKNKRLNGQRVLLLEKQPSRNFSLPEEYSNRVCALNKQTQKFFSQLNIWDSIIDMRAQPVKKMQVWEDKSESMITFDEQGHSDGPLAHIVENDVILSALTSNMPENVQVVYETNITDICLPKSGEKVLLTLSNGQKISTNLLIGADGSFSSVRSAMKAKLVSWKYDQSAIVATLKLSEEQENYVAWQKFLSTGPVAILPLSSTCSSLVWSTTKEKCSRLLSLPDDLFVDALNNALWQNEEAIDSFVKSVHGRWQELLTNFSPWSRGVLGAQQMPPSIAGIVESSRTSFPLGLNYSANYVDPRVALVGDAAHRVHPLAGQGVNLGFGDVISLVEFLSEAVLQGVDIGDVSHLRKYETARHRHNAATVAAVDGLHKLYSTSFTPVVILRSLGLSAVNFIDPFKKYAMAHAQC